MSTFIFKNKNSKYTSVNNIFIDSYMPMARGEFVKVYLLGLKYCMSGEPGVSSEIMASTLHLLETDVVNAWNYWREENVINMISIDTMGNYSIQFIDLTDAPEEKKDNINLLEELNNSTIKDTLQDIEKLLSRPLSSNEMSMYISWIKDFGFSPELLLLLIQYCASKGKTDSRYIEKIAIAWFDSKIKSVNDAQTFIKKHEDKWIKIRKILSYLGIKDAEVMKPQEDLLDKWINMFNLPLDVIFKACDICFERINKADFKYIDGILNSWHKNGIKTVEDVALKNTKKTSLKKNTVYTNSKDSFTNYDQRTYDFDDLEKKLLGWDKND